MTERLDRIEASLERAEQRAAKRDDDIDTLLGAIASTDKQVQETGEQVRALRGESADSAQRFEVLRAEAQADREEARRNVDMLTANIQRLEQSISKLSDNVGLMVEENRSQRETANNLIRLCTALVEQKAS